MEKDRPRGGEIRSAGDRAGVKGHLEMVTIKLRLKGGDSGEWRRS